MCKPTCGSVAPLRLTRVGRARGFTLLTVLALLVVALLGIAAIAPLWSHDAKRERERDLLRIGSLYAQALAAYRDTLPGSIRSYPFTLQELLLDARVSGVHRHLRGLYPDPIAPNKPWGLIRDEFGRTVGVYSQSSDAPLQVGPVPMADRVLPAARRYSDWKFHVTAQLR